MSSDCSTYALLLDKPKPGQGRGSRGGRGGGRGGTTGRLFAESTPLTKVQESRQSQLQQQSCWGWATLQ